MNQRIKELAQQADEGYTGDSKDDMGAALVGNDAILKFAELIIFECTNAVMDGTKEGDHYAQRIEQHFDNDTDGILHFGVEG